MKGGITIIHQDNFILNKKMLYRPRLHSLIREGLQYPLLVILAGPGYGKTQAMASCLAEYDGTVLWLRLSSLDNLPIHFWNHLIQVLEYEHIDLALGLKALEFPDTLSKFNDFEQLLVKYASEKKQIVWVFDDFGGINDQKIKNFFLMMAKMELDNFHFVLISNMLTSTESIAFMSSRQFLILATDLRFTQSEILELYNMYGISLKKEELYAVERYTEGWPLPLHLLVLQHNKMPNLIHQNKRLTHNVITLLFEERFFSTYLKPQQKLLIKLSMLNSFTKSFAIDLYEGDAIDLEILWFHVFLINEPSTDHYFFHHLYHLFLKEKKYLLNAQEKKQVWQKAAKYYVSTGDIIEAVDCYRKCGDHVGMLEVICDFVRSQNELTEGTAAYFLEHIDLLSPEEVLENPIADYLRVRIYCSTVQLEKAEALLLDLEKRLLSDGTVDALNLLGEVYVMIGAVHMMKNKEDFGDYYKKASTYLSESTKFQSKNKLLTRNGHNFSMADNLPGAKERMEQAVHYGVHWMAKVLSGGMSGMEHIFSAEAAYLSYQMEDAKQHAYRAVYKAEIYYQYDLVCNGYCILARIGFMQGEYEEMSKHIQSIVEYAERYNIGVLRDIRDTALGWYYIKLRDYKRVPQSILTFNNSDQPILEYGRLQIVYANYLINMGEYAKLIGMLENPRGLYLARGIWPDRICLFIMLAIGYYKLQNMDAAMEALWVAYDMSYNNGLTTLFIEAEHHICSLIDIARQQNKYKFSNEWLDFIYKQASNFIKRASTVRITYQNQNPIKSVKNNPLSKRERDVLQALSQGLTREEISFKYYISINTVKSAIRSIYNKLNANNRAEAVSIAIAHGYIEGYSSNNT